MVKLSALITFLSLLLMFYAKHIGYSGYVFVFGFLTGVGIVTTIFGYMVEK